jgi:carboxyl-terminal processing protease
MRSRLRSYLVLPLFLILGSLAAGLFIAGHVSAATVPDDAAINQSLKSFTQIYDVVEQNFADPVKADKAIYKGAIPGMLHTLDPHSNFFDPKDYASLKADQRDHYFGIGMTVVQHGPRTYVTAPFAGSPAYRAGLRPGDAIIEVNDKKTDGLGVSEVADLLRGPRGTKVQVKIERKGADAPLSFNIVRDEIPHSSTSEAFWLKPGIAYIKVIQFNENTAKEMADKLKKLGEKDIKGLVLDLRENPGGLLNEGVEVAGHFLKKNELVVSDRGRAQPTKNYVAHGDNSGKDYPIVVVVNRYSASAAEIVSGALQDHDRGWVLGETTFGKGLVQQVFQLSEGTGLALTTAHYYTPSGRLIQRDYSNISFLDYYYNTNNREQKNMNDVKMTDNGRTVYGGGGITPDEKYVAAKLNKFQIELLRKFAVFDFAAQYFGARKDTVLPKGWEPDENLVNEYHQFLLKNGVQFTEADFTANHQWVKEQLKHEFYITSFGLDDSERVKIEQDPEVIKAIESMPKAKQLLDSSKKQIVQRMVHQDRAE